MACIYIRRAMWLVILMAASVFSHADEISSATMANLSKLYSLDATVLKDYVDSYNFKCPQALDEYKLESIILSFDDYTELSIMMESHKENWRDIYIQARSGISCFAQGHISKAY